MNFPSEFVWGAAAASYQIEGAAYEDGKGLSVWDMMCRQPGRIWSGNTGDIACDHYHRYEEGGRLMVINSALGLCTSTMPQASGRSRIPPTGTKTLLTATEALSYKRNRMLYQTKNQNLFNNYKNSK